MHLINIDDFCLDPKPVLFLLDFFHTPGFLFSLSYDIGDWVFLFIFYYQGLMCIFTFFFLLVLYQ